MIEAIKFDSNRIDSTTIELRVTVPAAELSTRYQEQLYNTATQLKLPGFRPGRIPLHIIKSRFGETILQELAQEIIQEAFPIALTEAKVDPVATAEIDDVVYGENQDINFTAKVPVAPEFEAVGFDSVAAWKYQVEVTEADIDASLEELRVRHAKYLDTDLAATADNFLACEIAQLDDEGFVLKESVRQIQSLPVSGDPLGATSSDQLLGAIAGETRKVEVTETHTHGDHTHENKYTFRVKVERVLTRELPEVTDEYAQMFTSKFKTVADLRDALKSELQANADRRAEEGLLIRLRDSVIAGNTLDLPPALVSYAEEKIKERLSEGRDIEIPPEFIEKIVKPAAENEAKWELLAERIAQQLSIEPTDEEIEHEIQVYAKTNKVPVAEIREKFEDPVRRRSIKIEIAQQKTLKAIRDKAVVEDKPIVFAEFGKLKEV